MKKRRLIIRENYYCVLLPPGKTNKPGKLDQKCPDLLRLLLLLLLNNCCINVDDHKPN